MEHVAATVMAVLDNDAHRATKYVSPKEVVRATRVLLGGKINRRDKTRVVLTIGRPNFREREFIKLVGKAGAEFPFKKIQLQFPPKRRRTL